MQTRQQPSKWQIDALWEYKSPNFIIWRYANNNPPYRSSHECKDNVSHKKFFNRATQWPRSAPKENQPILCAEVVYLRCNALQITRMLKSSIAFKGSEIPQFTNILVNWLMWDESLFFFFVRRFRLLTLTVDWLSSQKDGAHNSMYYCHYCLPNWSFSFSFSFLRLNAKTTNAKVN